MQKYYEVLVSETGKAIGSREPYSTFNSTREVYKSLEEVKDFLSRYGKCKREKMYRDTPSGDPLHIGYIYCFRNKDISHDSKPWTQQDWVEIREVQSKTIVVR